jgi:hypothetical protein
MLTSARQERSPRRLPDREWDATINRVRGEFEEMPCMRVTAEQARVLFGLRDESAEWVLRRLNQEGFLIRTPDGQYVRRSTAP